MFFGHFRKTIIFLEKACSNLNWFGLIFREKLLSLDYKNNLSKLALPTNFPRPQKIPKKILVSRKLKKRRKRKTQVTCKKKGFSHKRTETWHLTEQHSPINVTHDHLQTISKQNKQTNIIRSIQPGSYVKTILQQTSLKSFNKVQFNS